MITDSYIIQTEFLGPDDFNGSRIRATHDQTEITIDRDMSKRIEACHEQAAETLVENCGLNAALIGGENVGGGYVFVLLDKFNPLILAGIALGCLLDKEAGKYTPIQGDDWDNPWVVQALETVPEVLAITNKVEI